MATPKKKIPTGERPKQLSILAKTVKSAVRGGVAPGEKARSISASEAASRAGKIRDVTNKAATVGKSDANGLALKKAMSSPKPQPNKVEKLIQDVTNRYRVTAREARDIITAAGTSLQTPVEDAYTKKMRKTNPNYKSTSGPSTKNLVKQVGEVAKAAATGKKGTTSDTVKVEGSLRNQTSYGYQKGKKRK